MDLWSIRIIVEDKFKELFSEYFENFDGYLSSSLFQDKDLSIRYNISKSYNLKTNKFGEFHHNKKWILEVLFDKKPKKKVETKKSESNKTKVKSSKTKSPAKKSKKVSKK